MDIIIPHAPLVLCDNLCATQLVANHILHSHMKHIEIYWHFIRDQIQNGTLEVRPVYSNDQLVDTLIKPIIDYKFQCLKTKLMALPSP